MPSASSSPLSSPRRPSKESEMYFRKSRPEDDVLVPRQRRSDRAGRRPTSRGFRRRPSRWWLRHCSSCRFQPSILRSPRAGPQRSTRQPAASIRACASHAARDTATSCYLSAILDRPAKHPLAGPTLSRPQPRRARCPGQGALSHLRSSRRKPTLSQERSSVGVQLKSATFYSSWCVATALSD